MFRYETLILAGSEVTADEVSAVQAALEAAVKDAQGSILSFERWGKYRLAYPVRSNSYGVYYLTRFEVDAAHHEELLNTIKTLLAVKFNEVVLRFMMVRLDANGTLAYSRPESLEEAPSRSEMYSKRSSEMAYTQSSEVEQAPLVSSDIA